MGRRLGVRFPRQARPRIQIRGNGEVRSRCLPRDMLMLEGNFREMVCTDLLGSFQFHLNIGSYQYQHKWRYNIFFLDILESDRSPTAIQVSNLSQAGVNSCPTLDDLQRRLKSWIDLLGILNFRVKPLSDREISALCNVVRCKRRKSCSRGGGRSRRMQISTPRFRSISPGHSQRGGMEVVRPGVLA